MIINCHKQFFAMSIQHLMSILQRICCSQMDVAIFCNNTKFQCSELKENTMQTQHLSSRLFDNSHKQFLNELGASYVGVCNKLVLISMVVEVICNNNKLANELVQFRVCRSQQELQGREFECLFDQSFTKASGQVPFWAYGVNNSNSTTWRKQQ